MKPKKQIKVTFSTANFSGIFTDTEEKSYDFLINLRKRFDRNMNTDKYLNVKIEHA